MPFRNPSRSVCRFSADSLSVAVLGGFFPIFVLFWSSVRYGEDAWALLSLFNHLVIGWPMYLLIGATGSPERGTSSHFIPNNDALFPGAWKGKVLLSDVGVLVTLAGLFWWGSVAGSLQVSCAVVAKEQNPQNRIIRWWKSGFCWGELPCRSEKKEVEFP